MFDNVGISLLIKSKDKVKFSIEEQWFYWIENGMISCVHLTHMKSYIQCFLIMRLVEVVDRYHMRQQQM